MAKKNKNKNADHSKKKTTIELDELSAAAELLKLGDGVASSSSSEGNEMKIDGGDAKAAPEGEEEETLPMTTETEKMIDEEESWINQDSDEIKPLSPILFIAKLGSESNRLVIQRCSQILNAALTLTENYNKISYISVLARDPQKREHQLRFSRYDDVQQGTFILHHEWAQIVAGNGLKEGDVVIGRGSFIGHQFRVVLSFMKSSTDHDSNVGAEGISRERNQEPESGRSVSREEDEESKAGRSGFLFEKELDKADLRRLVISCCSERLKIAVKLAKEPFVRVFSRGDANKALHELWFSRNPADQGEETYFLHHEWGNIVAHHGLEEGDLVSAFGNAFSTAFTHGFLMLIRVFKKGETGLPIPVLLFQKKLESTDTNDRLVIKSCKDVVKEIVARAEEVAGSDGNYVGVFANDEGDRDYDLRLSRDPEGCYVLHHQWRNVVAANGLMTGDSVSCWGGLALDGKIEMKLDVVKALDNVG